MSTYKRAIEAATERGVKINPEEFNPGSSECLRADVQAIADHLNLDLDELRRRRLDKEIANRAAVEAERIASTKEASIREFQMLNQWLESEYGVELVVFLNRIRLQGIASVEDIKCECGTVITQARGLVAGVKHDIELAAAMPGYTIDAREVTALCPGCQRNNFVRAVAIV